MLLLAGSPSDLDLVLDCEAAFSELGLTSDAALLAARILAVSDLALRELTVRDRARYEPARIAAEIEKRRVKRGR